jgi:hypothetical protein
MTFAIEKSGPIVGASSVIFAKLPKWAEIRPIWSL